MKKNSTLLLLLLAVGILGSIAYWVMKTDESSGGGKVMSDFKIENTDDINKIIITEITGYKAELELIDGTWMINNKFRARPENVELLLNTFRGIAVQSSVSNDLRQMVVANMAARHKKVEIFTQDDLAKTYYIGSATQDHYGTFMLLEQNGKKSTEPFIMHLPGFNGFLESRFYTDENDWKYSGVFVYNPIDIKEVKVEFNGELNKSYIITQQDKKVELKNIDGSVVENFNNTLVENYLLIYEKVFYNRIVELSEFESDSIINSTPTYTVTVTTNGGTEKVNFHLKPSDNPYVDFVTGIEQKWDDNYIYGAREGEKELFVFQYFSLANMFSSKEYFIQ